MFWHQFWLIWAHLHPDELVFDPTNVKKHGLSYITFCCIWKKEQLYLLTPLQHQNFHIDQCVVEEMNRLKTFANWTTFVLWLKFFYHSHVIIQALHTNSLGQHYQDINHDHNLQVSHVLCILETKIQSSNDVQNFIYISKHSYISIYDGPNLIMMYNAQMFLHFITQNVMDQNIY
jgi:hypothetical protein